jgi:hypothetical protein
MGQTPLKERRQNTGWTPARFLGVILLVSFSLLLNAWWHIQVVRLGYQAARLHSILTEAKSESESLHEELSRLSAFPKLEEWAKSQGRRLPKSQQLVLVHE